MKVLITGICGFVGSSLARFLLDTDAQIKVYGIDNLARNGSEQNRAPLLARGVRLLHGDIRLASDLESLPRTDWVIDAAALPSVLAGVDGRSSSRQLTEHNLGGTLNLLEHCRSHGSGLILLSTSRVYSIAELSNLPLTTRDEAFHLEEVPSTVGLSKQGIAEDFSNASPISLYGATKRASEVMALEYGMTFDFPVWINRCGVLAGAGQFGRADQGIVTFWLNAHLRRRPLRYLGFKGSGHQVRDCLHPWDLGRLIYRQMTEPTAADKPKLMNVSGGIESAFSLRQLTTWCNDRFGAHTVEACDEQRPFDLPWVVLDASLVKQTWGWHPMITLEQILNEIADHAQLHPNWLEQTS